MNKIGKRILAAAVASSVLVTPVFADPSVDDLKKSKESAQNEVSSLQTQLNTVVGKITELESQLSSKGEEIIQAQSDLEDAEAEEQKQYADMKVRIKYMYEAGDQSAVESLVGSEDFSDMVNKAEYVSNVHNYDRQKLQEYVETKQKISELKDQLEEEQSQLESMQTEYESQESKLDNLIASKQAEVSDLEFVSADDAWDSFKQTYFEGNEAAAESFAGDNPLANDASYSIYMNDISMQQTLVTYLQSVDGIREVKQSAVVANTLTDFNKLIGYVSAGIIIILLGVAVFLISNTITVGISVRREEIGIMRLIGAKNSFIKAPFLIEGVIIGLVGAALPLAVLYYLYHKIVLYVAAEFNMLTSVMKFLPVNELFSTLLPVGMLLGVGIGFFGSVFTSQRHLKV